MDEYYIYMYFRLDGSPCYVGKGKDDRWKQHLNESHNTKLLTLINQCGGLPVVILQDGLSEKSAYQYELSYIQALGREIDGGCLFNIAPGTHFLDRDEKIQHWVSLDKKQRSRWKKKNQFKEWDKWYESVKADRRVSV